jgi:glutamate dehydrogenase (NADP+)
VPAALENQIHADNAGRVRARTVVEVANGPVTPDGDAILDERGIALVPDILANAGGVTVSYFEWVQNRNGFAWTLEEVHHRLAEIMRREAKAVFDLADERGFSYREAAYVHALARLSDAVHAKGTSDYFSG